MIWNVRKTYLQVLSAGKMWAAGEHGFDNDINTWWSSWVIGICLL